MRHVMGSDTSVTNTPGVITSPFDRQRFKRDKRKTVTAVTSQSKDDCRWEVPGATLRVVLPHCSISSPIFPATVLGPAHA
jgi:hypothetical protein